MFFTDGALFAKYDRDTPFCQFKRGTGTDNPAAILEALVPELGAETALGTTVAMDPRAKAKMQGYEGDPCGDCGNYTLVRNGTCMKCNTCGGTSGCS